MSPRFSLALLSIPLKSARTFRPHVSLISSQRLLSSGPQKLDSIVLNAYAPASSNEPLELADKSLLSDDARSQIRAQLTAAHATGKLGEVRVLYGIHELDKVAVVGVGKRVSDRVEVLDMARQAAAVGVRALRDQKASQIGIDISLDPHAAAEGAYLAAFSYDSLKSPSSRAHPVTLHPIGHAAEMTPGLGWETGVTYAESQNLARTLMETPANLMTPTLFTEKILEVFKGMNNVEVVVREEAWAQEKGMGAFLSVGRGSDEPSKFVEIHYRGGKEGDRPLGLVGKGVTFDSGGISIKPSGNMSLMKGDMGGAAAVVGALYGIAQLGLPVNIIAATSLVENMPSGKATKPGDVVRAMNGKTIEADALHYVNTTFAPHTLIDLATLTGAIDVALGRVFAGVFTNSDKLWHALDRASAQTNDRLWRMPLHKDYLVSMKSHVADLINAGERGAGACTAAAFLGEFVEGIEEGEDKIKWAHLDIAGVMDGKDGRGIVGKGMTGRPTRTVVEFVRTFQV